MKNVGMTIGAMVVILSVANVALADTFGTGTNQFTIDFVDISGDTNPTVQQTNEGNLDGYGIVNNDYRIGTYEITNGQWDKFTNIYGTPTGSPSRAYEHDTYWTGTNLPTTGISWYEAAQFVNWLNTSTSHQAAYKFTGTPGTTDYTFDMWESGDAGYDADNQYRNSNAYYFLPTEDEWVKAAYWNGTSIQYFATKDDTFAGMWSPTGGSNSDGQAAGWNYDYAYPDGGTANDNPWDVTAGYSPEELNGTFDMMGNVWEWMEHPYNSEIYLHGRKGCIRGGGYNTWPDYALSSGDRDGMYLIYGKYNQGFRVASIPEPCSLVLLSLGGLMLRRRRAL